MHAEQSVSAAITITFGLYVEKWRGPHIRPSLDNPTLGRAAFLALLETYLGLSSPSATAAARTASFLVALRAVDTPDRFFHRSLESDEIGTAAQLLRWRDEWFLAGWAGSALPGWPSRLADMAAVEANAGGELPPGEGERLAVVIQRLDERRVPISEIVLLEDRQFFPAMWRSLLDRFKVTDASVQESAAPAHTSLGRLQRAAWSVISGKAEIAPQAGISSADDSLTVLRPYNFETAEHWLSSHCHTDRTPRLLVSENHGPAVDDTLRVSGLPACGFDESSALRPGLQALPLAFETFWDPVEPGRLLDFLMHPIGPFSARARRMLGAAFAEQPGIGGPSWAGARARILAEISSEQRPGLDLQIQTWLESPRSSRAVGAPIEYAIERINILTQALYNRLEHIQAADLVVEDMSAAIGQCAAVLHGLQSLQLAGVMHVRPRLLEQLCAQATADSGNSLAIPEVSCMLSATAPEACAMGRVAEVVWWMPSKPVLPAPHPWVRSEIDALTAAGVVLNDTALEMRHLSSLWMRPLLVATERLILVLPPEPAEDHPAWQLIKVLAPELSVAQLEEHPMVLEKLQEISALPLVPARGVWKLDPAAAWREAYSAPTRTSSQSHTSLDLHFNNPAIAVLKYAAGLQAGGAMTVAEDTRLLGNLAHRLLERLFSAPDALSWEEAKVDLWFEPTVEEVLRQEGMPLLAPGNGARLLQFKNTVRRGIWVLLQHLMHAGVVRVEAERPLKGAMGSLDINGATDLLLHLNTGGTAALDLKWSRSKRYREMLAKGDFLQLALYAEMIRQEIGVPPAAVGYFTFKDAILLTLTPDIFGPQARVINAKSALTGPLLIEHAKASWAWRVKQWEEGHVEVIEAGLDPVPSDPPENCLPLRLDVGSWHGDFTTLFGCRE